MRSLARPGEAERNAYIILCRMFTCAPVRLCRPGSKLESLAVNSNHLEGAIPDAIGDLTALRELMF